MFLGFSLLIITFRFRKGVWGYFQGVWENIMKKKAIGKPIEGGAADL